MRSWLKNTAAYDRLHAGAILRMVREIRGKGQVRAWVNAGKIGPPPPLVKQRTVVEYGRRFRTRIFVETGTHLGLMIAAVHSRFRKTYSIELDEHLFADASRRFARFDDVVIDQGDSGDVLPRILASISEPSLFWLDGHYSGDTTARGEQDTPIVRELDCILSHPIVNHVILIDDARNFTGKCGYPDLAHLRALILEIRPDWTFEVADDMIRIHP
jgi:hypothetical protein